MKSQILLLVAIMNLYGCKESKKTQVPNETNNQIVIGQVDSLYSTILGESREIWVHVPFNTREGEKHPVLYLLDGKSHFYSVTGILRRLSHGNGNRVLPEMIVVAILNTDRNRDLTPTHVSLNDSDSIYARNSGGGPMFLRFIENELMPYVENKYPTSHLKTFVGHSFGGLTVIDELMRNPDLFDNYIAIDPSLWWDDQIMLIRADSVLSTQNFKDKSLFVGIANTMMGRMSYDDVAKDTTELTEHIRSIIQFVETTESMNTNGLLFDWKYYEQDDHRSVALITEYDALRFLFSWYQFKGLDKLADSSISIDESIDLLLAHYDNVSAKMGYKILPSEELVNDLGYLDLYQKNTDRAAAFFDLNIQNFPESSNAYYARGDCYLASGDSTKALEAFKKSLEIEYSEFSQAKIEMLNTKFGT
ncbi:alpha/beta hydrolase-fold protein [Marinoscillum sp.]|uniref:alpha/beta hydrolase-fold protein n=1 Tax=Marinoscillum sp. TaxID=2024838 RepID=UPI003BABEAFD